MYNPEDKELNQRAERIIENEILCCDSSLVDALLQLETPVLHGFTWENVENTLPDPDDWDLAECVEYCSDMGIDDADTYGMAEDDDDYLEAWRDQVRDNAEPAEVFEWWRVSSWLCGQMRAMGEPVLDNDYGYWWGRKTTGQAIIADGILQRIVQRNEPASK
jgi:hypothetical protein